MRTTPSERPLAIHPLALYIRVIPLTRVFPLPPHPHALSFLPSRIGIASGCEKETEKRTGKRERDSLSSMINLNARARKSALWSLIVFWRNIGKTDVALSIIPGNCIDTQEKDPTCRGSVCIFGKLMKVLHNSCLHERHVVFRRIWESLMDVDGDRICWSNSFSVMQNFQTALLWCLDKNYSNSCCRSKFWRICEIKIHASQGKQF